jgi:hypothetical protein
LIQIIITRGKGKESNNAAMFNNIAELAETAFGTSGIIPVPKGSVKIGMAIKKYSFGHHTDITVTIDPEHNASFETTKTLEKYFLESNKGASFNIKVEAVDKKYYKIL